MPSTDAARAGERRRYHAMTAAERRERNRKKYLRRRARQCEHQRERRFRFRATLTPKVDSHAMHFCTAVQMLRPAFRVRMPSGSYLEKWESPDQLVARLNLRRKPCPIKNGAASRGSFAMPPPSASTSFPRTQRPTTPS